MMQMKCHALPRLALSLALGLTAVLHALAQSAPAIPNASLEDLDPRGFAASWHPREWGPAYETGQCVVDNTTARTGQQSLRITAGGDLSRPGADCQATFRPGRYALSVWAKAAPGPQPWLRLFLADAYSRPCLIGPDWTPLTFRITLTRPRLRADVRLELVARPGASVWVDDVTVEPLPALSTTLLADPRPAERQPRALYCAANLNYLRDSAANWVTRGFAGFMIPDLMHSPAAGPWAEDNDPGSVGEDDHLFQEARNALRECAAVGLSDNAMKISLTDPLPDPFDAESCAAWVTNFREGARFARDAGLRLIILDTEFCAPQLQYDWKGYDLQAHSREDIARQTWERWRDIGRAIGEVAPTLDLGVTPEGVMYYGPLWTPLFSGLLEGLALSGSSGAVHLFCRGTDSVTDPELIREHAQSVRAFMQFSLDGEALRLWNERGGIALGVWPLGYYRAVRDGSGQIKGWSGKVGTFGDRLVGAFADKSERYTLDEFRTQWAAARTYSDRYCWVYGHGSSWWQVSAQQADRYAAKVHRFARDNYLLPTVPNIADYYRVVADGRVVALGDE